MRIDAVNQAAEAYLQDADPATVARLEFLKGLWVIQAESAQDAPPYEAPDPAQARDALATGQPLFLVSAPEIPAEAYRLAVERVASYITDNASLSAEETAALRGADIAGAVTEASLEAAVRDPDGFVEAVIANLRSTDENVDLSDVTVAFVLASALVPFLIPASEAALAALGEYDWSIWGSGDCPVCGSAAAHGRVTESTTQQGGGRFLWCSACHAEWGYERIRCVRCGTRVQDKLRYTYEESDPVHRLYLCDECRGYVKFTIENEMTKPLSLVVEDAVSIVLDAIARTEGYSPEGAVVDADDAADGEQVDPA